MLIPGAMSNVDGSYSHVDPRCYVTCRWISVDRKKGFHVNKALRMTVTTVTNYFCYIFVYL